MGIELRNGITMPQIGYGLGGVKAEVATDLVSAAINAGYRLIDNAVIYGNETEVGVALAQTDVARDELFITTKVWPDRYGYDNVLASFDESRARLQLETIDLYLLHWPAPALDLYVDSWRALIELHKQGRVRAIGVSNFYPDQLQRLADETGVMPVLNQIELHPYNQRHDERRFHAKHNITTECWSPLGRSTCLEDPVIVEIAAKYNRRPAQIVLRWSMDQGLIVIPRSRSHERMQQNIDSDGFTLDADDHERLLALDKGPAGQLGPPPEIAR